jgi:hypothetical protein
MNIWMNGCHMNFTSSYKFVCQMCFQCIILVCEKRMNYGWTIFAWFPLLIREMLSLWWHAFIMVNLILKGYNTLIGLKKMPKLEVCEWFAHMLPKRKWNTKLIILNPSIIAINTWNNSEQIFIHQHLEVCKNAFPIQTKQQN